MTRSTYRILLQVVLDVGLGVQLVALQATHSMQAATIRLSISLTLDGAKQGMRIHQKGDASGLLWVEEESCSLYCLCAAAQLNNPQRNPLSTPCCKAGEPVPIHRKGGASDCMGQEPCAEAIKSRVLKPS
jgi:hypothetical protein